MDEETRKQIDDIIGQMQCPKGFRCADSGFEQLCKAKNIGLEHYLECGEDDAPSCKFSLTFGNLAYYCQCPLRVYISRTLRK